MPKTNSVLTKLVRAMGDLDDTEVNTLVSLLRDPRAVSELELLLKSISRLRSRERAMKPSAISVAAPTAELVVKTRPLEPSTDDAEALVSAVFQDRALFPSVKDVVWAANKLLGCPISNENLNKSSRQRVIRKIRSSLQATSKRKRVKSVNALLDYVGDTSHEYEGYRELFRLLATNG